MCVCAETNVNAPWDCLEHHPISGLHHNLGCDLEHHLEYNLGHVHDTDLESVPQIWYGLRVHLWDLVSRIWSRGPQEILPRFWQREQSRVIKVS